MKNGLTISPAAEVIPIHRDTLRRWEKKGWIKASRDYRGFRVFQIEDLLKLRKERLGK